MRGLVVVEEFFAAPDVDAVGEAEEGVGVAADEAAHEVIDVVGVADGGAVVVVGVVGGLDAEGAAVEAYAEGDGRHLGGGPCEGEVGAEGVDMGVGGVVGAVAAADEEAVAVAVVGAVHAGACRGALEGHVVGTGGVEVAPCRGGEEDVGVGDGAGGVVRLAEVVAHEVGGVGGDVLGVGGEVEGAGVVVVVVEGEDLEAFGDGGGEGEVEGAAVGVGEVAGVGGFVGGEGHGSVELILTVGEDDLLGLPATGVVGGDAVVVDEVGGDGGAGDMVPGTVLCVHDGVGVVVNLVQRVVSRAVDGESVVLAQHPEGIFGHFAVSVGFLCNDQI